MKPIIKKKLDVPSGTALKVAKIVSGASGRDFEKSTKFGRMRGEHSECPKEEIRIHSVRIGDVVGDHELVFAGPSERLEIVHRAQSRQAFASGTMRAIRYVVKEGEPGVVKDMQNVLGLV